jgi:hypothetical protein
MSAPVQVKDVLILKCPDCWQSMELARDIESKLSDFLGPDKTRKVMLSCGCWMKAERFERLVRGK